MTTPSTLSPVVGEAQASPKLTDAERAAMGTDLHVIACDTPLGQCVECMTVLRTVRRIEKAIGPLIEEQATKPLKERLEAAEAEYRLLADGIGLLAGDGWDDDAAEVAILIDFVKHLATFHPDCPGCFCDQQPPVAASSIPIPDGEPR